MKLDLETKKRLSWDDYFYKMAEHVSSRSRDDTAVGAVITNVEHAIVTTGYNGLPRGVADLPVRLEKKEKLQWTVHAEANALCNAARSGIALNGCSIYVTKFPCARCAGELVQAGIRRVFCLDRHFWRNDPSGDDGRDSLRIFMEAGVEVHTPNIKIGELPAKSIRTPDKRAAAKGFKTGYVKRIALKKTSGKRTS